MKTFDNFYNARDAANNAKGYPAARAVEIDEVTWAVILWPDGDYLKDNTTTGE